MNEHKTIRLTDHEKRILSRMEMGKEYHTSDMVRLGFSRGVQERTMQKLWRLGFFHTTVVYFDGHEHDWDETGQYYILYRKIKDYEVWTYTI